MATASVRPASGFASGFVPVFSYSVPADFAQRHFLSVGTARKANMWTGNRVPATTKLAEVSADPDSRPRRAPREGSIFSGSLSRQLRIQWTLRVTQQNFRRQFTSYRRAYLTSFAKLQHRSSITRSPVIKHSISVLPPMIKWRFK